MKQNVLVNIRVEIEVPHHVGRWCRTKEDRARAIQKWADEFHEFIRDHRSQDPLRMEVIREMQDQCSHCNHEWEEDETGEPQCCAKAQDEWAESKATPA